MDSVQKQMQKREKKNNKFMSLKKKKSFNSQFKSNIWQFSYFNNNFNKNKNNMQKKQKNIWISKWNRKFLPRNYTLKNYSLKYYINLTYKNNINNVLPKKHYINHLFFEKFNKNLKVKSQFYGKLNLDFFNFYIFTLKYNKHFIIFRNNLLTLNLLSRLILTKKFKVNVFYNKNNYLDSVLKELDFKFLKSSFENLYLYNKYIGKNLLNFKLSNKKIFFSLIELLQIIQLDNLFNNKALLLNKDNKFKTCIFNRDNNNFFKVNFNKNNTNINSLSLIFGYNILNKFFFESIYLNNKIIKNNFILYNLKKKNFLCGNISSLKKLNLLNLYNRRIYNNIVLNSLKYRNLYIMLYKKIFKQVNLLEKYKDDSFIFSKTNKEKNNLLYLKGQNLLSNVFVKKLNLKNYVYLKSIILENNFINYMIFNSLLITNFIQNKYKVNYKNYNNYNLKKQFNIRKTKKNFNYLNLKQINYLSKFIDNQNNFNQSLIFYTPYTVNIVISFKKFFKRKLFKRNFINKNFSLRIKDYEISQLVKFYNKIIYNESLLINPFYLKIPFKSLIKDNLKIKKVKMNMLKNYSLINLNMSLLLKFNLYKKFKKTSISNIANKQRGLGKSIIGVELLTTPYSQKFNYNSFYITYTLKNNLWSHFNYWYNKSSIVDINSNFSKFKKLELETFISNNKLEHIPLSHMNIGFLYIKLSYNNTFITLCDINGNVMKSLCAGKLGIKGSNRSNFLAAEALAESIFQWISKEGIIKYLIIKFNGSLFSKKMRSVYSTFITNINKTRFEKKNENIKILQLTNITPRVHNGVRHKKQKTV